MAGMKRPACMDEKEYVLWAALNDGLPVMYRASSPCRDCTPDYHRDMDDGGMCDGVPGKGDAVPAKVGPKKKPREYTYAELKEMRAQYSRFGAPASLLKEIRKAYFRERERDRRSERRKVVTA